MLRVEEDWKNWRTDTLLCLLTGKDFLQKKEKNTKRVREEDEEKMMNKDMWMLINKMTNNVLHLKLEDNVVCA